MSIYSIVQRRNLLKELLNQTDKEIQEHFNNGNEIIDKVPELATATADRFESIDKAIEAINIRIDEIMEEMNKTEA